MTKTENIRGKFSRRQILKAGGATAALLAAARFNLPGGCQP